MNWLNGDSQVIAIVLMLFSCAFFGMAWGCHVQTVQTSLLTAGTGAFAAALAILKQNPPGPA